MVDPLEKLVADLAQEDTGAIVDALGENQPGFALVGLFACKDGLFEIGLLLLLRFFGRLLHDQGLGGREEAPDSLAETIQHSKRTFPERIRDQICLSIGDILLWTMVTQGGFARDTRGKAARNIWIWHRDSSAFGLALHSTGSLRKAGRNGTCQPQKWRRTSPTGSAGSSTGCFDSAESVCYIF